MGPVLTPYVGNVHARVTTTFFWHLTFLYYLSVIKRFSQIDFVWKWCQSELRSQSIFVDILSGRRSVSVLTEWGRCPCNKDVCGKVVNGIFHVRWRGPPGKIRCSGEYSETVMLRRLSNLESFFFCDLPPEKHFPLIRRMSTRSKENDVMHQQRWGHSCREVHTFTEFL